MMRHFVVGALIWFGCVTVTVVSNASTTDSAVVEAPMTHEEAQKVWDFYYEETRAERMAEAKHLNDLMSENDAFDGRPLVLEFSVFGSRQADLDGLETQLAEIYDVVSHTKEESGYTLITFTNRRNPVGFTAEQHVEWAAFISDVARSYACFFSTWRVEDPESSAVWSTENIDVTEHLFQP